jgi:hypothetical protein
MEEKGPNRPNYNEYLYPADQSKLELPSFDEGEDENVVPPEVSSLSTPPDEVQIRRNYETHAILGQRL